MADVRRPPRTPARRAGFRKAPNLSDGDRIDIAEEAYRFGFNEAQAGVASTPNPIVRAIQRSALLSIRDQFGATLAEFIQTVADLRSEQDRLAAEIRAQKPTPRGAVGGR